MLWRTMLCRNIWCILQYDFVQRHFLKCWIYPNVIRVKLLTIFTCIVHGSYPGFTHQITLTSIIDNFKWLILLHSKCLFHYRLSDILNYVIPDTFFAHYHIYTALWKKTAPLGINFSEILIDAWIVIMHDHSSKCILKFHLENGGHFVYRSQCDICEYIWYITGYLMCVYETLVIYFI